MSEEVKQIIEAPRKMSGFEKLAIEARAEYEAGLTEPLEDLLNEYDENGYEIATHEAVQKAA